MLRPFRSAFFSDSKGFVGHRVSALLPDELSVDVNLGVLVMENDQRRGLDVARLGIKALTQPDVGVGPGRTNAGKRVAKRRQTTRPTAVIHRLTHPIRGWRGRREAIWLGQFSIGGGSEQWSSKHIHLVIGISGASIPAKSLPSQ